MKKSIYAKINFNKKIESVELKGIKKQFPEVLANNGIDFDVHAGEIHALLGENGAGKSTLMKILYGIYNQDEGSIFINKELVKINSPINAIQRGIGMVHQHFMLVPTLTVAENVALGLYHSKKTILDIDAISKRIIELGKIHGLYVEPKAKVWQLSVGEQQRLEILKVLYYGASLLILHEPTAVLNPQEVEDLFKFLKGLVKKGFTIIFISHKLNEVLTFSDRITVLRNGKVAKTLLTKNTNKHQLAYYMVGKNVNFQVKDITSEREGIFLSLENISAYGDRGIPVLKNICLDLFAGEILGIAGISGNGQRELAEAIVGLRKPSSGKIVMKGEIDITNWSVSQRIKNGFSYIPEERMIDGAILEFTVEDNLILKDHINEPYSKGIWLNCKYIFEESNILINEYNIKTPSCNTLLKRLSGGNIQKLILARELSRKPSILVASQPTRGLDISAIEYIHSHLVEQKKKFKLACILISDDLDEVLMLSDRVAVIYEGKIVGITQRNELNRQEIGLMMGGAIS